MLKEKPIGWQHTYGNLHSIWSVCSVVLQFTSRLPAGINLTQFLRLLQFLLECLQCLSTSKNKENHHSIAWKSHLTVEQDWCQLNCQQAHAVFSACKVSNHIYSVTGITNIELICIIKFCNLREIKNNYKALIRNISRTKLKINLL